MAMEMRLMCWYVECRAGYLARTRNPRLTTRLYVREISGRNWHARTPKVTQLNSLFFALCLPKIYSPRRCTFEEATDSESQKISSDLLIVCWRKRGFIVFAGRANIGHFFLRRRAGLWAAGPSFWLVSRTDHPTLELYTSYHNAGRESLTIYLSFWLSGNPVISFASNPCQLLAEIVIASRLEWERR